MQNVLKISNKYPNTGKDSNDNTAERELGGSQDVSLIEDRNAHLSEDYIQHFSEIPHMEKA